MSPTCRRALGASKPKKGFDAPYWLEDEQKQSFFANEMDQIVSGNHLNMKGAELIEETQIGLYVIQKGRFAFVNSYLVRLLGYENAAELIGRSFWAMVCPDDMAKVSLRPSEASASVQRQRGGFRLIKKDGRTIWVRMKGRNTAYNGRRANVGHVEEITRMRKLEGKLEKYRNILDEVEDAVAEVDLDGNLFFVNASGAKRFGNSIKGVNCDQIETYLQEKKFNYSSYVDEETVKTVRQAYRKVYDTGVSNKNIIYEIIKRDGQRLLVEDSVALIRDRKGEAIGFRTVSRDISNRVRAEKKMAEHRSRLEAIFRSVEDAIITIDSEHRVIEANAATTQICGVAAEAIVGRKFPDCIDGCNNSCRNMLLNSLDREEGKSEELRIECAHKDRGHQVVTVSGSPLLDSEGRSMGAVLVIRDITRLKRLESELVARHQFQNIIGKSKKMQEIFYLLKNLSNVETTVLITGQSGTGKELVARALHYGGQRAQKPFITVNCSALAENLLESELFGHVKGAFTGAIHNREGRFYAADGGTIMLDEIGDISPLIQLKLLRVIQEKEFERVGEIKPHKVDVRIIACTNKDLRQKVKNGQFREDLFYRLKVMEINLPPLKERAEDIPLMVDYFCKFFENQFGKRIDGVSNDVMESLLNYNWPGNVRELKHVIERAFVLCNEKIVSKQHLPAEVIRGHKLRNQKKYFSHQQRKQSREAILSVLNRVSWNKSKAAKVLGISRQTLYRRIEEHQIQKETEMFKIYRVK